MLTEFSDWVHDKFNDDDRDCSFLPVKACDCSFPLTIHQRALAVPAVAILPTGMEKALNFEAELRLLILTHISSGSTLTKVRVENLHYDITESDLEVRTPYTNRN